MTGLLEIPNLIQLALPGGQRPYLVDAIGPLMLIDPSQPHIKLTMTPFLNDELDLTRRDLKNQRLVEVHVADLMTIGPGTLSAARRKLRHPRTLFQRLKVELNMEQQDIVPFQDLQSVFGPHGAYALPSTWSVVKSLSCLRFRSNEVGIVLIPCLDAWRFVMGCSSRMLQATTSHDFLTDLSQARTKSSLEDFDQTYWALPPQPPSTTIETADLIRRSTLHLDVPKGYSEGDLSTLSWLMTDGPAFAATTRFYDAIVKARQPQPNASSAPAFRFPFAGRPVFTLYGLWLDTSPQRQFLALHIERCTAAPPQPAVITHELFSLPGGEGEPGKPIPPPRLRSRKPKVDEGTEVDSLRPPDTRLSTLHLGLTRQRFGGADKTFVRSRLQSSVGGPVHTVGPTRTPDKTVSTGGKTEEGKGGRQVQTTEQPPPPSRPVDHRGQFCDLLGVCQELERNGITTRFLALNRTDPNDPTTPIPATAGSAATWVGKGIQARRALIAMLSWKDITAYALEWERLSNSEYGKLLLLSAGESQITPDLILDILSKCATDRGVWINKTEGVNFLVGISHSKPHRTHMSKQIIKKLELMLG
jgi:hypothetical protein